MAALATTIDCLANWVVLVFTVLISAALPGVTQRSAAPRHSNKQVDPCLASTPDPRLQFSPVESWSLLDEHGPVTTGELFGLAVNKIQSTHRRLHLQKAFRQCLTPTSP